MITDPIYIKVVIDPDGLNIDLTDYLISVGSVSHKKSIYPDERLNAWDASDIDCIFSNDEDYFAFDGPVLSEDVIGKRVYFYMTTESVAEDLPIGVFIVSDIPTIGDDYKAYWSFKSKQRELMDKQLWANSIRIYKPGYVYPDVWHRSLDYEGVSRSDGDGNPIEFDETTTSDGSAPYGSLTDVWPYPIIGGRCPLGEWTIRFIDGRTTYIDGDDIPSGKTIGDQIETGDGNITVEGQTISRYDYYYNSTKTFELRSPNGIRSKHNPDFIAVAGVDTIKSATQTNELHEEIFVDSYVGKINQIQSVSGDKVYYKALTGSYDPDERDFIVGDSVFFRGSGDITGLQKEQPYIVETSGGDLSGYYIVLEGVASVSSYAGTVSVYLYEKPSDMNQDTSDTTMYDSYNWGRSWISPALVTLIIPKLKPTFLFKEGDTITFKTVWRSPAVDDYDTEKDNIGSVALSAIADNRYTFGSPIDEENWVQNISVEPVSGGIDLLEVDTDSFDLMDSYFNNILILPYFDRATTVWKAVEVIAKHLNCTVFVDKYSGKYTLATYRPSSVEESIFRITGYNAITRLTQKTYGIFRSVKINYDWQDGEFTRSVSYDYPTGKFGKLTAPTLELYCPGFRDTITADAILRGIARKYGAMWGDGLTGYDVDMVWNLAVGMNPNERYMLTSDRPTVDTIIELDSFKFDYDISAGSQGKKKITVTGFDVTRTFNEYAIYGQDTYNGGKVYW